MSISGNRYWLSLMCLIFGALLGGCATTKTDTVQADGDPWQPANRSVYNFNDKLDKYVLEPVAKKYDEYTPKLVREGVTNFFDNVQYLNVILNDMLQGKVKQGFSDIGRVTVNTTLGIGGLMDLATPMGLTKHDEDLGQTFGTWGAGEGRYLVLPFAGPNSVRDAPDFITSTLLNPLTYIGGVVLLPVGALGVINTRANLLDATRIRDEAALDPYTFVREAYRQRRTSLIYDGNPPPEHFDFEDSDTPQDKLKVD